MMVFGGLRRVVSWLRRFKGVYTAFDSVGFEYDPRFESFKSNKATS